MAKQNIWRFYDNCGSEDDFMIIYYIVAGFLSGIISGMGIGGGAILIPALSFIITMPQQQAQAVNLLFFIPTAIVAIVKHKKEGNIDIDMIKPVVIFGIVGALVGSIFALNLDGELLRKIFGGFLFVMGILEICKKDKG